MRGASRAGDEGGRPDRGSAERFLVLLGAMKRFVREELSAPPERGLSEARFRTLLSLELLGKSQLKLLAAHDGLSSPAQCIMLNRLVEEGLAARGNDPRDRRRALYELTRRGRSEVDAEITRRAGLLEARLAHFAAADRVAFSQAVETLLDGIARIQTNERGSE